MQWRWSPAACLLCHGSNNDEVLFLLWWHHRLADGEGGGAGRMTSSERGEGRYFCRKWERQIKDEAIVGLSDG